MHEPAERSGRRQPLQVRARLGETPADALDFADPEAASDERVQRDPARDDVPPRLFPRHRDTVRRERLDCLGLDQRQLVAAAAPRERAGALPVAVAAEPLPATASASRTRTSGASAAGATSNPATTPPSHRLTVRAGRIETELERRHHDAFDATEPPLREQPRRVEHRPGGRAEHEHRIALSVAPDRGRDPVARATRTTPGRRSGRARGCAPRATGARRRPGRRPASEARPPRARARRRGSEGIPVRSRSWEQRTPSTRRVAAEPTTSVTLPQRGHLHDAVSRMQGLVRRRAGDPRAAARRRPHAGRRTPPTSR